MTEPRHHRMIKEMMAGSIGMASASALLNPFDVIKVRLQQSSVSRPTLINVARSSVQEAGGYIRGLVLPGLTATILRDVLNGAFRVGLYKEIERSLFPTDTNLPVLLKKAVTGSIVGSLGAGAWSHTDLVKTRMQSQSPTAPTYRSTLHCYSSIYKSAGFRGLYQGVGPNMIRASLITTFHVGTYDTSKRFLLDQKDVRDGLVCWTFCGFTSALVTTTVSAPMDLIRTKLMLQPLPVSSLSVLRSILNSGSPNLFRGWLPSFYRFGPHFTISWPLIELVRTRFFHLDSFYTYLHPFFSRS